VISTALICFGQSCSCCRQTDNDRVVIGIQALPNLGGRAITKCYQLASVCVMETADFKFRGPSSTIEQWQIRIAAPRETPRIGLNI
jgi:hypothetical protein